jgi:hypothetical protein
MVRPGVKAGGNPGEDEDASTARAWLLAQGYRAGDPVPTQEAHTALLRLMRTPEVVNTADDSSTPGSDFEPVGLGAAAAPVETTEEKRASQSLPPELGAAAPDAKVETPPLAAPEVDPPPEAGAHVGTRPEVRAPEDAEEADPLAALLADPGGLREHGAAAWAALRRALPHTALRAPVGLPVARCFDGPLFDVAAAAHNALQRLEAQLADAADAVALLGAKGDDSAQRAQVDAAAADQRNAATALETEVRM